MIYFSFLSPRPACSSPNDRFAPPLRSPSAEPPRSYTLRRGRVFLVGCCIDLTRREPSKATTSFIFVFLFSFNLTPGSGRQHPPTRSALVASPLQRPPQRRRQLLFDCCVRQLIAGHHSGGAPFLSLFFSFQLAAPNEGQPTSPHVPPWSRALPETPSNVSADIYLIVACFH